MSKHQIIFTSCKRGIASANPGLQVYSYSANIRGSISDYAKNLLPYQAPPYGEAMTEEKAKTMPRAFVYRRLPKEVSAIVLKTYLGQEQIEPKGPFDNFISHGIIFDEHELTTYPAEYFGSGMFKTRMEPEEANSPEIPPYLPEPVPIKGQKVTLENVITFIKADNRVGMFNKMLGAMLSYKSARNPVIICDSPGNTIMWIAALHYALPLEIALDINFSTYEHDPSRSGSQICGVYPPSYSPAKGHLVFDFTRGSFPDIETGGSFFEFIGAGFTASYDSIQDFHKFIIDKLTYRNANEEYYDAYALYNLLKNGLANLSLKDFKSALRMADTYASTDVKMEVISKIFADRDFLISTSDEYALEIFKALLDKYPRVDPATQDYIKNLIGEKIIRAFIAPSTSKDSFTRLHAGLYSMSRAKGISISAELMTNSKGLLVYTKNNPEEWRWDFLVDNLCDYIDALSIPVEHLSMDHKTGRFMGDIIATRLESAPHNGFALIARILSEFSSDWSYLANLALNLEGVILDVSETLISKHWALAYDLFAATQPGNLSNIYKLFLSIDREDQVFEMFCVFMGKAGNVKAASELFQGQIGLRHGQYLQEYLLQIYGQYYNYLKSQKESAAASAKRDLLRQIAQENITIDFSIELTNEILNDIPFGALSKDNEKLIPTLLDYFRGQRAENMPGRLVLLATGMMLGNVRSAYELENAVGTVKRIAARDTIDLTGLSASDGDKFIGWVAPALFACSKSPEELLKSFEIFRHSKSSSGSFIETTAREAMRASKGDYSGMMTFLGFLFKVGNVDDRHNVGKVFCKLSRQRLEDLNEAVLHRFHGENKYLFFWNEVYDVAATTNPILNSIGNLFRRKK